MKKQIVYDVMRVTLGGITSEELWWTRSAAIAEAERLARFMTEQSKNRIVKRDDHDPERWNVLEADTRRPNEPKVIVSYYVSARCINGSVVDRLATVVEPDG